MMLSGKLSVGSLVAELVKAGRLSDSDAKLIQVSARQLLTQGQSQHALEVIAAAAATDQQQPSRTLDLEVVSEWVATLSGRPFFSNRPIKD
jgi:general secretion pathway protein E